ncbi:pre-mRNA-splicing factor ATP-dependent RNA helicase prp43 [Diaporthe helianthi]|uniref:Pre-mRNA-splicing factor ATP-dependent RNA helicase prp43 n=1 Tax=Diaporthe helianthi TaxID=158607 RepID=A0A2P5HJW0_DIAHE|nr:pre-mRNA-splicing factor ATP-dependent RNA helicase prp43 [Diaporthe helianthi]
MSQVYQKIAEEATALENASTNWMQAEPRPFSTRYRQALEGCRSLPVYTQRADFFEAVDKHDVLIVTSETGSGKSTQLPTYLLQFLHLKKTGGRMVACTQPRRVAAEGVATRVADINDVKLGAEVGLRVRFNNKTSGATRLVYMTDGLLLKEAENDRYLSKYSCVIVDEVHETGINTDLLMGILKTTLKSRKGFKVIIMSATLMVDKFSTHFPAAAVDIHQKEDRDTAAKGGILIFLPGEDHIHQACGALRDQCPDMDVLPLYSGLSAAQQRRALEPSASRKCVVATTIAETSLTIPDIKYVIDSVLSKQMTFNPRAGMHSLQVGPISKAQAVQRMGRAGRTGPRKCFRVCTEEAYNAHTLLSPVPAMAHSNMDAVLLKLHDMGYDDTLRFPFVDPPSVEILFRAKEDLTDMGLIHNFTITPAGKLAAQLPVDPIWYCAIRAAVKYECVAEIVSLAAIASIQADLRVRPRSKTAAMASDIAWSHFDHPLSDHITLLNALHAFLRTKRDESIDLERWCMDHFVSKSAVDEVCQLRDQIKQVWCGVLKQKYDTQPLSIRPEPGYSTAVRRALAEGIFTHTAVYHNGRYTHIHNAQPAILLHTSNISSAEWVVYNSFVQYGKAYFQVVTSIEPEWIMASNAVQLTSPDLPYFQDARLPLKFDRSGFRQRQVKELLDKARSERV